MAVILSISWSTILVEQVVQKVEDIKQRILKRAEVKTGNVAEVFLGSLTLKKLFQNKSND